MINYIRALMIVITFNFSDIATAAAFARGYHNNNNFQVDHPGNDNDWSYKQYYNGNNTFHYNNNTINPVVVNPVVVNPDVVDDPAVTDNDDNNDVNSVSNDTTDVDDTDNVQVYQYVDHDGVTHFSDLPHR